MERQISVLPLSVLRRQPLLALVALTSLLAVACVSPISSPDRPTVVNEDEVSRQDRLRSDLAEAADLDEMVMVPMRDGIRLATDVYRPQGAEGPLPTIFWRTPYNFNELRADQIMMILAALEAGYAFIIQNERGKFFSEGEWEILGFPRTDGYDALDWIAEQSWSNGKVGTMGCSSSAEWQLALAATDHPAHAAMIPMAAGAGIGKVGRYWEQGNWFRGGVYQMLFGVWLYGVQNTQRPMFPPDTSREDLIRLKRYFDLAPDMPDVDWDAALEHLPLDEMMTMVDGPAGIYEEFVRRKPNDPAWFEGGLYQDTESWGVPALWLNSWYDVSVGPNLELFNHATRSGVDAEVRDHQFALIAPVRHCGFFRTEAETIVGERNMGDARYDYQALIVDWFDRWLKEDENGFETENPKVRYYTMGRNAWQGSETWPPAASTLEAWYLDSEGSANSRAGDGRLAREEPIGAASDTYVYDPTDPVPSLGGGVCCIGGAVDAGSFDQRSIEARDDVLVYTSEKLKEGVEVTGFIETTLYVSSDAKDTDFTIKLIDVYPDGRAYNVDDTIQRARYREGYESETFMAPGEVYELELSPMATSNYFEKGHRIRVEISSSNFPHFARNLNTGGDNFDETESVPATNTIHHSQEYPSQIRLPVVR